ncbi:MAG: zf-HC2 domain-containing protein, partial [Gaiellaceae bacterium MAG52_C11]|nr:zf-HC2 domain-containing protein [Candidatus Gaiellasilicea maunaloa]
MSGCAEIRTELGAYALGALGAADAARVERHLAGCPVCRDELDQLAFASELLRTPLARSLAVETDETPAADNGLAAIAEARAGADAHPQVSVEVLDDDQA